MRKQLITVVLLFLFNPLFSQERETIEEHAKMKFSFAAGPMNLSKYYDAGIAINNSFEYVQNDFLIFAASLHIGKSGNNNTQYNYFKYYPDFPEDVETNFYETDYKNTEMNSFSSAGVFILLNPAGKNKNRFVFGPGLCFVSWEEMTTVFSKKFKEFEYYEIFNRITNRKKLDLGVQFNFERDITQRFYIGVRFQGYFGEESASSVAAMVGFRVY